MNNPRLLYSHPLLVLLLFALLQIQVAHADICFLLYQNADNYMESSLRANLYQWMESPAIRDPTVTTWVYFDALNLPQDDEEALLQTNIVKTPLENVYTIVRGGLSSNPDNRVSPEIPTLLTDLSDTKLEGSYYLTFDHDEDKMMVQKTSEEELDSDDPGTLWGFVGYAMQDCLRRNASDVMLVVNAYGAGSAGLGGDFHPQRQRQLQRQRHLQQRLLKTNETSNEKVPPPKAGKQTPPPPQQLESSTDTLPVLENQPPPQPSRPAQAVESNDDIVFALQQVLTDLGDRAPPKFSVIGFDGHYMQNFHAVSDYRVIADAIVASESLMPPHGK